MHALWTDEASTAIGEIARRHGFSDEAGRAMADALSAGSGSMAQFGHHELGGMGQWSRGGMLMIGDMFNHGLKARVGGLADDLSAAMASGAITARRPAPGQSSLGFANWWPEELGVPSATGAQNGQRYAVFPGTGRLAIERDGRVRIYDVGDHNIGGAGQQQGGGDSLSFSTDRGSIGVHDLREVGAATVEPDRAADVAPSPRSEPEPQPSFAPAPSTPWTRETEGAAAPAPSARPDELRTAAARPSDAASDPIELIRKLAALRDAGVLTDDEFQAKKTELLARI
ncbi:SHOCT domain-containing protein [Methylopila turkensis]|uniref:SHOCT domain-containing protein n=1 Tax=Methylopila turkensis TaxID=1437816 RepID=A0A9W6JLS0_9HYPH|nr:SHOCT domain-containing protein [Methylopila turkensis]GLK79950.1 hypothetical protein GCM10008174_16910 [Methylopila turkensis]